MAISGLISMKTLFFVIPKLSKILSRGILDRLKLLVLLQYFFVGRKLGIFKKALPVALTYRKTSFTLSLLYADDIAVLAQLYINNEYAHISDKNPKFILDLGAHYGDTALYFHCCFPEAKIIAVEPEPENFERLKRHAEHIPNISCVHAAVGAEDGQIELNVLPNSLSHSVYGREGGSTTVTVPLLSVESLLKKFGINKADIIKFDIEGAEDQLFNSSNPRVLSDYYIGEIHPDLMRASKEDFLKLFEGAEISIESIGGRGRSLLTAQF